MLAHAIVHHHAAGSDYTSSTATLTLEPGQPLPCFDIEILGDTMDERNELFGVTLTALSNLVAISDPSTEVCITDDDGERYSYKL